MNPHKRPPPMSASLTLPRDDGTRTISFEGGGSFDISAELFDNATSELELIATAWAEYTRRYDALQSRAKIDDMCAVTAILYTLERQGWDRSAVEAFVETIAPGGRRGAPFDYTNAERAAWAAGLAERLK